MSLRRLVSTALLHSRRGPPALRYSTAPWFVDPALPTLAPTAPKLATAPVPLPPPSSIPSRFHPLFAHLTVSPFIERDAITFIHAREADENAWTDWVVIGTLRRGREKGLRGAIEGIRAFLSTSPVSLSPAPAPSPFSPPSSIPLITGLPSSPSKHARARAPSPSREDQAVGWSMLDNGDFVVHVMTESARKNWDIEGVWRRVGNEESRRRETMTGMASNAQEEPLDDGEDEDEEPRYEEGEEFDSTELMDGLEADEMDKIDDVEEGPPPASSTPA